MDVEYSKDVKNLIDDVENTYNENIRISKRHAKKEAINKAIESVNNIIVKKRSNVSGEKKSKKRTKTLDGMDVEDESKSESASSDEDGGTVEDFLFTQSKLNLLKKAIKEEKDKGKLNIEIVEILIAALKKESIKYHNFHIGDRNRLVSIGTFGGKKTRKTNRRRRHSKKNKK
jgi:hypothetical protein